MKTTENIPSVDPAQESESAPRSRCRTGKIARLPLNLREELNERMLDGEEGKSMAQWLNSPPEVQSIIATKFDGIPVREQNLSEWRKGGHQDWLKQKETRGQLAAFLENIDGLQKTAKDGLTEQIAFFLAARVALELQRLESVPESEQKAKAWRDLAQFTSEPGEPDQGLTTRMEGRMIKKAFNATARRRKADLPKVADFSFS